jgi:hypothetical protein
MLKGASLGSIFAELAARLRTRLIVSTLAISRYCVTLDSAALRDRDED